MLPLINRLKLDDDFQKVFRAGKTSENTLIKIKFIKNGKKHLRFGFVVSNKFAKRAVTRNLIKRRLRSAVGALLKNIKPGFDIVVWPKSICLKSNYSHIFNALKEVLTNNDFSLV